MGSVPKTNNKIKSMTYGFNGDIIPLNIMNSKNFPALL